MRRIPEYTYEDENRIDQFLEEEVDYDELIEEVFAIADSEEVDLETLLIAENSAELELKPLLETLKYIFLEEGNSKPIIISSMLSEEQEEKLISIISKYKAAIGWKIDDIKGMHREICEQRIFLEEDLKPTRQPQRRLNPHIFEVVKKEILKWLKADFIYAISDSPWVSPVHVVPKK